MILPFSWQTKRSLNNMKVAKMEPIFKTFNLCVNKAKTKIHVCSWHPTQFIEWWLLWKVCTNTHMLVVRKQLMEKFQDKNCCINQMKKAFNKKKTYTSNNISTHLWRAWWRCVYGVCYCFLSETWLGWEKTDRSIWDLVCDRKILRKPWTD